MLLMWLGGWALAATLEFSPTESSVGFHASASLHEFDGKARSFSGSLDTTTLAGKLEVQSSSLTTFLGPRDARLQSWCLEAERFPTIQFVLGSVNGEIAGLKAGSGGGAVTLVGKLTIRDVTLDVKVPATYTWEGNNLRLKGRHDLRWADFGIPDPSITISTLYPDLYVTFDVVGRPKV